MVQVLLLWLYLCRLDCIIVSDYVQQMVMLSIYAPVRQYPAKFDGFKNFDTLIVILFICPLLTSKNLMEILGIHFAGQSPVNSCNYCHDS